MDLTAQWERRYNHTTRVNRHGALRRILRWLWEEHGAPKLDGHVPRLTGVRPRNVTTTREIIDSMVDTATPEMRLWLLLCSDLGIRSGTAVRLGPEHYTKATGLLSFTTKKGAKQTLPVTTEVAALMDTCDLGNSLPFVTQLRIARTATHGRPMRNATVNIHQLRKEFAALRKELGITKRITPHDLRRTTAVAMYTRTRDVRTVQSLLGHRSLQSTIWYLDHDLVPIERADLEALKKPFIAWRKGERTA